MASQGTAVSTQNSHNLQAGWYVVAVVAPGIGVAWLVVIGLAIITGADPGSAQQRQAPQPVEKVIFQ